MLALQSEALLITLSVRLNFCLGNALQEIQAYQKDSDIEHIFQAKKWLSQQIEHNYPTTNVSIEEWLKLYEWLNHSANMSNRYAKIAIEMIFATAIVDDVADTIGSLLKNDMKQDDFMDYQQSAFLSPETINQNMLLQQAIKQLDCIVNDVLVDIKKKKGKSC